MWSGLPAANNIISVLDSELDVDRHGNRIDCRVECSKSYFIDVWRRDYTCFHYGTQQKVRGSIHTDLIPLDWIPSASGYTIEKNDGV